LVGLVALGQSAGASAEPTATITTFTAKAAPVPKYEGEGGTWPNTGNCSGCGFALELDYQMEGEGYGATAKNPKGGIAPISQVNLYLPPGVGLHPAGFGTCTEATLKNIGPSGCPRSSVASPIGSALGEVTFGTERVPEEAELRAFYRVGGLLFFVCEVDQGRARRGDHDGRNADLLPHPADGVRRRASVQDRSHVWRHDRR
jgi:hypothetical protein